MTTATAYEPIVLLNTSHEVLTKRLSLHKAMRLLAKAKAIVWEDDGSGRFLDKAKKWAWPKVLMLVEYVKISYDKMFGPPRVSKRGVLLRDDYTCGYCGKYGDTIDHVQPRSRGGTNWWENLITACKSCNNRKDDRTPKEANMALLWKPYAPKRSLVMQ